MNQTRGTLVRGVQSRNRPTHGVGCGRDKRALPAMREYLCPMWRLEGGTVAPWTCSARGLPRWEVTPDMLVVRSSRLSAGFGATVPNQRSLSSS